MADSLFLGPCDNLAPDLSDSICGLTANPMNQGYASLLPLYTTADYLWNMKGYDKDSSKVAAANLLMPDCADALLGFEDLMSASSINGNVSTRSVSDLIKKYNSGSAAEADYDTAINKLSRTLSQLSELEEKGDKNFVSEAPTVRYGSESDKTSDTSATTAVTTESTTETEAATVSSTDTTTVTTTASTTKPKKIRFLKGFKYSIVVYLKSQSVAVYTKKSDGKTVKQVKCFTCSSGDPSSPTPTET